MNEWIKEKNKQLLFFRVMRNHGLNPTDDELKDMIRNVDKNSNGAIDFNEFIEMMLRRDSKAVSWQLLLLLLKPSLHLHAPYLPSEGS